MKLQSKKLTLSLIFKRPGKRDMLFIVYVRTCITLKMSLYRHKTIAIIRVKLRARTQVNCVGLATRL